MGKCSILLATVLLTSHCVPCRAEVKSSGTNHFTVTTETRIKAPPNVVWEHLVEIGSWWNASHTWSGDSKNLTLNATAGGGFDEALPPDEGSVRHMSVVYAAPGKKLVMVGVLGPLHEEALTGTMTVTFKSQDNQTIVTTTYKVAGHFEGGLDKIAPTVDKVLQEQFTRLSAVTEASESNE